MIINTSSTPFAHHLFLGKRMLQTMQTKKKKKRGDQFGCVCTRARA